MDIKEALNKASAIPQVNMRNRAQEVFKALDYVAETQDTFHAALIAYGFEAGRIFELGSHTYGDIPLETRTAEPIDIGGGGLREVRSEHKP